MVSTLLPRARSSSTCAARCMPHSSGARDLPPSGDSTSTRPYPAARSAFSLDRREPPSVDPLSPVPYGYTLGMLGGVGAPQATPPGGGDAGRVTRVGAGPPGDHPPV